MSPYVIPGIKIRSADKSEVINAVCQRFGLTYEQMSAKGKADRIARPRQLCMWILRRVIKMSFKEIGKTFNRDHSTAIHGVEIIEGLLQTDDRFRSEAAKIILQADPRYPIPKKLKQHRALDLTTHRPEAIYTNTGGHLNLTRQ